jgi:hypothetical protein
VAAWRSPKGANVWFLDAVFSQKRANVSLKRAGRPSFCSYYDIFLAINVKNSVNFVVNLVGCFNDLKINSKVMDWYK